MISASSSNQPYFSEGIMFILMIINSCCRYWTIGLLSERECTPEQRTNVQPLQKTLDSYYT